MLEFHNVVDRTKFNCDDLDYVKFYNIVNLEIPEEILKHKNIKYIAIKGCNIKEIPKIIYKLQNLEVLHIFETEIENIDYDILNLKKLTELGLASNKLKIIPSVIYRLDNLVNLSINNNPITQIDPEICQLKKLKTFTINSTFIDKLPIEITKLENIDYFNCEDLDEQCNEIEKWMKNIQILKRFYPESYAMSKIISENITIIPKKIIIKETTNIMSNNYEEGVFAEEDIQKGTIFALANDISIKINDLAWYGDIDNYETMKNIKLNINTIICAHYKDVLSMFSGKDEALYLQSIKDIKKGEELSRLYGLKYWKKYMQIE
jgi:hypothetical protein